MTETSATPAKSSTLPEGVKSLAMASPLLGVPLLLHAVTGAVVGGVGLAAVSFLLGPAAKQLLPGNFSLGNLLPPRPQGSAPATAATASEEAPQ